MRRAPLLALGLCLAAGPAAAAQGATYEQLQTFSSLLNQIRLNYVDTVAYPALIRAAIEGVLDALDPHSSFMAREDAERMAAFTEGRLAGTGIMLDEVQGLPTVVSVLPRGPAAKAGIQAGDRLVAVDDTVVLGRSLQSLELRMLGEKGQRITLSFNRGRLAQPDTFRVTLKREIIEPRSVEFAARVDPSTGYVRLGGFQPNAGKELEDAINRLRRNGATRLLLDLRGNGGGMMGPAVEVASLFLPDSTLVFRMRGNGRTRDEEYVTRSRGRFAALPLIVLVDAGTASASEAVAGSLQDHDRALIAGYRTFGKGLIQRPIPIPPQGDAVWLTVARLVTPSGRVIQRPFRDRTPVQYRMQAGQERAAGDSAVFRTGRGRPVRGEGGIEPDVVLSPRANMPIWSMAAWDSAYVPLVADSVARTLDPASWDDWKTDAAAWEARLVQPLLARVREGLGVNPQPDSAVVARMALVMAARATEVRWGPERAGEIYLLNDPEVKEAARYFEQLPELLGEIR